jgi:hypothetical protein
MNYCESLKLVICSLFLLASVKSPVRCPGAKCRCEEAKSRDCLSNHVRSRWEDRQTWWHPKSWVSSHLFYVDRFALLWKILGLKPENNASTRNYNVSGLSISLSKNQTRQAEYEYGNIEMLSWNHCCSGKTISSIPKVCVCSFRFPAWNVHAPRCYVWPLWLYNILHIIS